jgi:hypothetical protein
MKKAFNREDRKGSRKERKETMKSAKVQRLWCIAYLDGGRASNRSRDDTRVSNPVSPFML